MPRIVIGIMGGANVDRDVLDQAAAIARHVAVSGHVLLTGGRDAGVMGAASHAAAEAGGLVIGILPGATLDGASAHLDVAIRTGLGDGRNVLNVLSSDAVVVLRGDAGTLSELALAAKNHKPTVALGVSVPEYLRERVAAVDTVEGVVAWLDARFGANE